VASQLTVHLMLHHHFDLYPVIIKITITLQDHWSMTGMAIDIWKEFGLPEDVMIIETITGPTLLTMMITLDTPTHPQIITMIGDDCLTSTKRADCTETGPLDLTMLVRWLYIVIIILTEVSMRGPPSSQKSTYHW